MYGDNLLASLYQRTDVLEMGAVYAMFPYYQRKLNGKPFQFAVTFQLNIMDV